MSALVTGTSWPRATLVSSRKSIAIRPMAIW
jgi:hypothetical protein